MNEYLEEAKEELKRVDHIIYVSLKYTRTVDVIRNALHRMISAFEYIIDGVIWHHKEEGKVSAMPKTPRLRIDTSKSLYEDDKQFIYYIDFYVFLRELIKAPYTKREEYRRHVTMISELEKKTSEITIDVLEDNFDKIAKDFLDYVEIILGIKKEED